MMFSSEGKRAIEAIDAELERLHGLLAANTETNYEIFVEIKKLSDTLDKIARRHNGLEY